MARVKKYQNGGIGDPKKPVTRQDSLDVINSSQQMVDALLASGYVPDGDLQRGGGFSSKTDEENLEFTKRSLEETEKWFEENKERIPEDKQEAVLKKIEDYKKELGKKQSEALDRNAKMDREYNDDGTFLSRESDTSIINEDLPKVLYNTRVNPTGTQSYYNKQSGDVVSVPVYDKVNWVSGDVTPPTSEKEAISNLNKPVDMKPLEFLLKEIKRGSVNKELQTSTSSIPTSRRNTELMYKLNANMRTGQEPDKYKVWDEKSKSWKMRDVEPEELERYKKENQIKNREIIKASFGSGGMTTDPTDPKKSATASDSLNVAALKSGISQVESSGGQEIFMINPDPNSTATGLYGQRFSEIQDEYDGSRTEFSTDLEAQEEYMNKRIEQGINAPSLKRNAIDLTAEYKDQLGDNWDFTLNEVAALSHFLGRGGARKYFASIRDGEDYVVSGTNKTPEEYLEIFNEGESKVKNYGGYVRPIKRGDNGVTVDYETEDEEKNRKEEKDFSSKVRDTSDYKDVLDTLGGLLKEYMSGEGVTYSNRNNPQSDRQIMEPGNPILNIAKHAKGILSQGLNKYIQENIRPADYPDTKKLLTEILFANPDGTLTVAGKNSESRDIKLAGLMSDDPMWTDTEGDLNVDEEAYAMALGRPVKNKHFQISEHTPSKGHKEGDVYYKSPAFVWDALLSEMNTDHGGGYRETFTGAVNKINGAYWDTEALGLDGADPYQNFTAYVGEDEGGTFISYYDKFDFASPAINNVIKMGGGKPVQFYDKKYVNRDSSGKLSFVDSPEEDPTLRSRKFRKDGGIVKPIKRGDNGVTTKEGALSSLIDRMRDNRAKRRVARTNVKQSEMTDEELEQMMDMISSTTGGDRVPSAGYFNPATRTAEVDFDERFKPDDLNKPTDPNEILGHELIHSTQFGPLRQLAEKLGFNTAPRVQDPDIRKSFRKVKRSINQRDMGDGLSDYGNYMAGSRNQRGEYEAIMKTGITSALSQGVDLSGDFDSIARNLSQNAGSTNIRQLSDFMNNNNWDSNQKDIIMQAIRASKEFTPYNIEQTL